MSKTDGARGKSSPAVDFRVGGWLVQPQLGRVSDAAGVVAQVQPKVMEVLVQLAERPGEVFTREELFRTVWAGTHVTEHALARTISELRKVFRDSHRRPRVVETIPKIGYRLIAPVFKEPAAAPEDKRRRRHSPRLWFGLGALSAATLLLTILFYLLTSVRHVGPWHPGHH